MPTTEAPAPRTCPECDGFGFHKHPHHSFGVPCACCQGTGTATRADIQAHDRYLDAASETARKAQTPYVGVLPASHFAQMIPAQ